MASNIKKNTELEIITPTPTNFLKSVNKVLLHQLKTGDTSTVETPTLLSKAKTLVFQKNYIILLTTKEDS